MTNDHATNNPHEQDLETVRAFLSDALNGGLPPSFRSDAVPKLLGSVSALTRAGRPEGPRLLGLMVAQMVIHRLRDSMLAEREAAELLHNAKH